MSIPIPWLRCWDRLRESLDKRTTWGRNQILDEMATIERQVVREINSEINSELFAQHLKSAHGIYTSGEFQVPFDCPVVKCFLCGANLE